MQILLFFLPKRSTISHSYTPGKPLQISLGGKNNTSTSILLILISREDFWNSYQRELGAPYALINPRKYLNQKNGNFGFKLVRTHEVVELGRNGENKEASSRLGLDQSNWISKEHVKLVLLPGDTFLIQDVGSLNGTFLSHTNISKPIGYFPDKSSSQKNTEEISKDPFLKKLWPYLIHGMKQGPVGNCYFVAAINSIKEHPQGVELLRKIIQPDSQGYKVSFLGRDEFTIITQGDITEMKGKKLQGALGDLILERAYWRLRHSKKYPNLREKSRGRIGKIEGTLLPDDGIFAHEGGIFMDVLEDFFGENINYIKNFGSMYRSSIFDESFMYELYASDRLSELSGNEIISTDTPSLKAVVAGDLSTPPGAFLPRFFPQNSEGYQWGEKRLGMFQKKSPENVYAEIVSSFSEFSQSREGKFFTLVDKNGKNRKFFFNHAYSIGYRDTAAGYVEIINPHDTINQRFYVKIIDFYAHFDTLTIAEPNLRQ